MNKYDVIYILKYDVEPYELRYSLRSIEKNLPHGDVWFVCGQPFGLIPDRTITMRQKGILKWEKARSSMLKVCSNPHVPDKFWLFNDDFFVLKPVESETPFFGGTLRDHILHIEHRYNDKHTGYTRALRYCEFTLNDSDLPTFDYALHVPMLIEKEKMLAALESFPDCPMFRSLYGNYAGIGGNQHDDVKIVGLMEKMTDDMDYVSTSNESFKNGIVGKQIRDMFPDMCRYEYGYQGGR